MVGLVAGATAAAQRAPLPLDSATVRSLLADAFASAIDAPPGERGALVTAIGRFQTRFGDFAGAERTVASAESALPGDVARAEGNSVLLAFLDRPTLFRRLVCGLQSAGRSDDAIAAVRRMPAGDEREWELAHTAALMARSRLNATDSIARRNGKTPVQWRTALALAREVTLPEARLDALISIAGAVSESAKHDVARAAYGDARRIRVSNADRKSARTAMLAAIALRIGRRADVSSLYATLTNGEDLREVVTLAANSSDVRLVRELAPRAVDAGLAIRDSAARLAFLSQLRQALIRGVGDATADDLLPANLVETPRVAGRAVRDSMIAASTDPWDVATRASERGDFAAVRRAVEQLPVSDPLATRARLWSNLAWGTYSAHVDTARVYLILARDALLRSHTDSATIDEVASAIADRQFWLADDEAGITTVNLVRDPGRASGAMRDVGGSTLSRLTADRAWSYADQIREPRVRDALALRVITGYLAVRGATAEQLLRGRALADSITTLSLRIPAQAAVANGMAQRGDTVGARALFTALLSYPSLIGDREGRTAVRRLIAIGGMSEVEAWARSGTPAMRARRLIAVADAVEFQIAARAGVVWARISNGPDACLDGF
jgi:hypothetical protein